MALPRKQVPRAQTIFVAQAGRKFRLFSLTLQRYKNFKALPNYSSKKARFDFSSKIMCGCGHYGQLSFVINVLEIVKYDNYSIIYVYYTIIEEIDPNPDFLLTIDN